MARPPVIGITGVARSGKDTVANMIIARCGGYRYSFADPMRRMLAAGLNIDMGDPYWIANKETVIPAIGKSPRQLMQTLGTEWGRQLVSPDLWVTLAKATLQRNGPGMVIPDIRFESEADWVRSIGGRIYRLGRANAHSVSTHVSEDGITTDPLDTAIANNGSLKDLHELIGELFRGIEA